MKKTVIIIALLAIVVMIAKVCAQQPAPIVNTKLSKAPAVYNVSLHYVPGSAHSIPLQIFGINTGFTFKEAVDKNPDFVSLVKNIHPSILRFPGGTVANYYHPNAPGYGFKYDEISSIKAMHPLYVAGQKTNENIIENFIRLCKATGAKATYCANLLTGTPQEALDVIARIRESGVELIGVELGNEYNLMMYRKQYPTVTPYINKAKVFATAIRQKYPELPLGVIMGDEVSFAQLKTQRGKFQLGWSAALAKQNFYDAVIVHYYPKCDACKDDYLETYFQKSLGVIAPFNTHYLDSLAKYVQQVFPGKKIWITEWNTGDWNSANNTYLQTAFTSQFLLNAIDVNNHYPGLFSIYNFHFLGSDGLLYETKGKLAPLQSAGKYATSSVYYPFAYLAYITQQKGAKLIDSKLNQGNKNAGLVVRAFANDSSIFIYYVNAGANSYNIHFSDKPVNYTLEFVQGSYLSSAAGKTYFDKNYTAKQLSPMKNGSQIFNSTDFYAAPYSNGYIEFRQIR